MILEGESILLKRSPSGGCQVWKEAERANWIWAKVHTLKAYLYWSISSSKEEPPWSSSITFPNRVTTWEPSLKYVSLWGTVLIWPPLYLNFPSMENCFVEPRESLSDITYLRNYNLELLISYAVFCWSIFILTWSLVKEISLNLPNPT